MNLIDVTVAAVLLCVFAVVGWAWWLILTGKDDQ